MHSDILIVGAGLAGLHCALRLSEKFPKKTIRILESSLIAGGRVHTIHHSTGHIEAGAGRIPESHPLVSYYCDKYSLTKRPLDNESLFLYDAGLVQENLWSTCIRILEKTLADVPKSVLCRYTISEILTKLFDAEVAEDMMYFFPYRSELKTLRADVALHSFANEFSNKESFYVIQEGLSSLIRGMETELETRGVPILYEHRVTGMGSMDSFPMSLTVKADTQKTFTAGKIIFAVHANALRSIRPFTAYPILKHLKMEPLLRTYATFPTPAWFTNMPRVITANALRHIIPINAKKGVIMISYTDAADTKVWEQLRKKGDHALARDIMKELRTLFPMKTIPNLESISTYSWEEGATYWTPGLYDPVKESNAIMRPFPTRLPDVYVCGESYSMKQAWMEGALEHADAMLERYFFRTH